MLNRFIAGLILAVVPTMALAEIVISGETTIQPNKLARLKVTGQADGSAILWDIDREDDADHEEMGASLVFAAKPGTYRVKARSIMLKDGKTIVETARVTVTFVGAPGPVVPPTVPPVKPPTTEANPRGALCQLRVGSAGCTATVIGPRRADGKWNILTAAHCMGTAGKRGTIKTSTGKTLNVSRTAIDRTSDICWMVTDDVVADLPFAYLAKTDPAAGVAIWHAGFGVDKPGNVEKGSIVSGPSADGQLQMTLSVSHGDSGGGIFREDTGELVANVCCTKGIGLKTTMWGGCSTKALTLLPKE